MRGMSAEAGRRRGSVLSLAKCAVTALAVLGCGSAQVLPPPANATRGGAQPETEAAAEPALSGNTGAPAAIYLVRHAEKESDGTSDPALTAEGGQRAALLARMLGGAGLTAIHSTPYRRTLETAEAVGSAVGLPVQEYDPRDLKAFAASLLEQEGVHLVVGHSNTTPGLVRLLGGEPGSPIPEEEYDRIYLLIPDVDRVRTSVFGFPDGFPPATHDSPLSRQPPDH